MLEAMADIIQDMRKRIIFLYESKDPTSAWKTSGSKWHLADVRKIGDVVHALRIKPAGDHAKKVLEVIRKRLVAAGLSRTDPWEFLLKAVKEDWDKIILERNDLVHSRSFERDVHAFQLFTREYRKENVEDMKAIYGFLKARPFDLPTRLDFGRDSLLSW